MIVVSDTSCITNLIAIGRVGLLRDLFGNVVIPSAVRRELEVEHESLPDFLHVCAPQNRAAVEQLLSDELDAGEAEAIVLAEELHADFLLMDEAAGRAVAEGRGLFLVGLIGVLRRAKEAGYIAAVRPDFDALLTAGFRVAPKLQERFLRDVGEA